MPIFITNCTHLLTRTQANTFEDVLLVKIASKGTAFSTSYFSFSDFPLTPASEKNIQRYLGFNLRLEVNRILQPTQL